MRGLACAVIQTRVEVRGFQNVRVTFCDGRGGRAENAQALDRSGGREHLRLPETEIEPRTPELLTEAEAENTRAFRRRR